MTSCSEALGPQPAISQALGRLIAQDARWSKGEMQRLTDHRPSGMEHDDVIVFEGAVVGGWRLGASWRIDSGGAADEFLCTEFQHWPKFLPAFSNDDTSSSHPSFASMRTITPSFTALPGTRHSLQLQNINLEEYQPYLEVYWKCSGGVDNQY
ncbi:hypothetical protein Moror_13715 [Moniliophthora roreri MCA 2997]|uniref:Uncharacterized protein n=2 Tax=Moniliophthora roreri TaxID=221103 RepID=V2X9F5_MONRO|nr:hypothetical protein Moror_13715 [Moniliophthora roreri MCA 2997]